MSTILKIENISKQYRLGVLGTGTLSHDLNRFWHLIRGKDDPYLKVGEINERSTNGNSNLVWALKDININVKKGDIIGIIGKKWSGKIHITKNLIKSNYSKYWENKNQRKNSFTIRSWNRISP